MTSEYMARNANALAQLEADPNVEILRFPEAVLAGLKTLTYQVVDAIAAEVPYSDVAKSTGTQRG
jgi:hypothetical protein